MIAKVHRRTRRSAFTLAEMMMALGVISLASAMIYGVFTTLISWSYSGMENAQFVQERYKLFKSMEWDLSYRVDMVTARRDLVEVERKGGSERISYTIIPNPDGSADIQRSTAPLSNLSAVNSEVVLAQIVSADGGGVPEFSFTNLNGVTMDPGTPPSGLNAVQRLSLASISLSIQRDIGTPIFDRNTPAFPLTIRLYNPVD